MDVGCYLLVNLSIKPAMTPVRLSGLVSGLIL